MSRIQQLDSENGLNKWTDLYPTKYLPGHLGFKWSLPLGHPLGCSKKDPYPTHTGNFRRPERGGAGIVQKMP